MYKFLKQIQLSYQAPIIKTLGNGFISYDYDDSEKENEIYYYDLLSDSKKLILKSNYVIDKAISLTSTETLLIESSIPSIGLMGNGNNRVSVIDNSTFLITYILDDLANITYISPLNDLSVLFRQRQEINPKLMKYGLIDVKSKRIIWSNDSVINPFVFENYIFSTYKNFFMRYSNETGELLWKIDVTDLGKGVDFLNEEFIGQVSKIVCVYKGLVYIAFKASRSAAIDIETGEIVWDMLDLYIGNMTPQLGYLKADPQDKNILKGFWAGYYVELDLNTRVQSKYSIETLFKSNDLGIPNDFSYDDPYLFYVSNNTFYSKSKMAAFNSETRQIDWLYDFTLDSDDSNMDYRVLFQPIFEGNYMYIYDSNKMLYVFSKENY